MVGKPSREVSRRSFMQVVSGSVIGGFVLSWFPEVARAVEPGKSPGRPWYLEEGPVSEEVEEAAVKSLRKVSATGVAKPLPESPDDPVEFFGTRQVSGGRTIITRSVVVSENLVEVTHVEVLVSGVIARQRHERWFVDESKGIISLVGKGASVQSMQGSVTPMVTCGPGYYECVTCASIDWERARSCCSTCSWSWLLPTAIAVACMLARCVVCYNTSCVYWDWTCCEHVT